MARAGADGHGDRGPRAERLARAGLLLGAAGAAGAASLALAGLYGARQLMRPPPSRFGDEPSVWGLRDPEVAFLPTADGLQVCGWWFFSPEAHASVVVVHGHGGSKATNLWVAGSLLPRFNVLLIDTRAHGESEGLRSSVGYLERQDVLAAVTFARQRVPGAPVGAYGISMGASAAILAAAESPQVACVIADSPFARLRTPVSRAIAERGYPRWLSPTLGWAVCTASDLQLGLRGTPQRDPIDAVHRISPRPLLLIHGEEDGLTPASEARELYARAGEPKELWITPDTPHAQSASVHAEAYRERALAFLERTLLG